MQAGSHITAGGKVNILAQGAGMDNDITVLGSDIYGQGNVTIKSDGTMNLKAASDTHDSQRDSSSMSGGVGVAITYGQNGFAFGVTANASGSRGNGTGHDETWNNSHIGSGGKLTIESGGDADFSGAVLKGQQVTADIGGNLTLASLQDTSQFKSKDQSIGGSVTVGYGFSGSASISQQSVNGDYASVREQAGILAGDGGGQVNVKGNTHLDGAIIASSQDAIDNHRNSFTTGTLTTRDIENHSDYDASGFSLSGGYSVGTGKSGDKPAEGQSNATKTDWQGFNTGPQGGGAGFSETSGSDKSITRSGISGAQITITDEEGQKALTGKDANETIANLNRDVTNESTSNGLNKNWAADKLSAETAANVLITSSFGQAASKAIGDYAAGKTLPYELARRDAADAQATLQDPTATPEQRALAQQAFDQAQATMVAEQDNYNNWKDGGAYKIAAHAIAGGLSGGVNGALGATASTISAPAIHDALTLAGVDKALTDTLTQLASTAAGSVVGGTAGGAAAFNEVTNNYLKHQEANRLAELAQKRRQKQCDAACQQEIKDLLALDKTRDQQLSDCAGVQSAACNGIRQEVRNAAAEYVRLDDFTTMLNTPAVLQALPPDLYREMPGAKTIRLANGTLDGKFVGWTRGVVTGAKDAVVGMGTQALGLLNSVGLGNDQKAAEGYFATGQAVGKMVITPSSWPLLFGALTPDQSEELAQAYARGDGSAVGQISGKQIFDFGSLFIGGGVGKTGNLEKTLVKAEQVAKDATAAAAEKAAATTSKVTKGVEGTVCSGVACFTRGTLVQTAKGLQPIESFRGGELVLSRDEHTQALGYRPVIATKVTHEQALYEVVVRNPHGQTETLHTTSEHPFWIVGTGWIKASLLEPGMALLDRDGQTLHVASQRALGQTATVYNIQVDEHHTYHVGRWGVWVHNADCCNLGGTPSAGSAGIAGETGTAAKGVPAAETTTINAPKGYLVNTDGTITGPRGGVYSPTREFSI